MYMYVLKFKFHFKNWLTINDNLMINYIIIIDNIDLWQTSSMHMNTPLI